MPAGRDPGDDHVIADGDARDAFAHGDDLAGALVAEHRGQGDGQGSVLAGQIRVAHAARFDLDPDLARSGSRDLDVFVELDLFADGGKDCCAHGRPPGSELWT